MKTIENRRKSKKYEGKYEKIDEKHSFARPLIYF